jgi:hypothetical protein
MGERLYPLATPSTDISLERMERCLQMLESRVASLEREVRGSRPVMVEHRCYRCDAPFEDLAITDRQLCVSCFMAGGKP